MNRFESVLEKTFRFFSSIKLAIIVIFSLGVICATGTIYEARYDAEYAQKMVYQSPYMYFVMGLLCINLINVMVDRWPWKPHHTGFVLAHIGIIILLMGSLITQLYGVDGSMAFEIGQKNRHVSLSNTEVTVYASFGDGSYKLLQSVEVDFFKHPPEKEAYVLPVGQDQLVVKEFYPWAQRDQKIVPSTQAQAGPAIRVQLQNERVNLTEWMNRSLSTPCEDLDLGPAKIVLCAENAPYSYRGGNEIVLRPIKPKGAAPADKLKYEIYTKSKGGQSKAGILAEADTIETGWMGLRLTVLKFIPHAEQRLDYRKRDRPNPTLISAIRVQLNGQDTWVGLNSNVRFFADNMMYLVAYRNRLLDVGFDIRLEKFNVGRYQGTNRAMSYESLVEVDGLGEQLISMNNPLKHGGYTFYQASFQEDDKGAATTSILSVNRDPGRVPKYLGSLLIVMGTIVMFYFKRYRMKIFGSGNKAAES